VLPAPWETWWARTLFALTLLAGTAFFIQAQRRKLHRERVLVARERAANERLREADRVKDQFLANTSHELRTPLFGIVGLAELLQEGKAGTLPSMAQRYVATIGSSARRLQSLVQDLLDVSAIQHNQLELHRQAVDLHPLVSAVVEWCTALTAEKELWLVEQIPADLPPADIDPEKIRQVLVNLVGNAIKFTMAGEVRIWGRALDEEWLEVGVTDTGIGIDPSLQERIFHAFEQADGSAERTFGGTGLGLAISRRLVELHGGELRVDSKPGEGSTFTMTLPRAASPVTVRAATPSAAETGEEAAGPGTLAGSSAAPQDDTEDATETPAPDNLRILVVDDEAINRMIVRIQLSQAGYTVLEAVDGPQALEKIAREAFDLIVLDIMMPRMSGYEVCHQLRESYSRERLPILFLSAKDRTEDIEQGLAVGGNAYLVKPVSQEELVTRVGSLLEGRGMGPGPEGDPSEGQDSQGA
jgi:signal transduction histidine kinase/ActR/RegA family two-component response regulator